MKMSSIKKLIDQLELEDLNQRKYIKKLTVERSKVYEKLHNEMISLKDECSTYMNNIVKNLEQLLSNKSTIETILEQTDNLNLLGLPIPYQHHEVTVDLVSKVTEFINNYSKNHNRLNDISPNEIQENIINITESVATNLKECHNEVSQAQTLYFNTITLKNLVDNYNDNDDIQKLQDLSYVPVID